MSMHGLYTAWGSHGCGVVSTMVVAWVHHGGLPPSLHHGGVCRFTRSSKEEERLDLADAMAAGSIGPNGGSIGLASVFYFLKSINGGGQLNVIASIKIFTVVIKVRASVKT